MRGVTPWWACHPCDAAGPRWRVETTRSAARAAVCRCGHRVEDPLCTVCARPLPDDRIVDVRGTCGVPCGRVRMAEDHTLQAIYRSERRLEADELRRAGEHADSAAWRLLAESEEEQQEEQQEEGPSACS